MHPTVALVTAFEDYFSDRILFSLAAPTLREITLVSPSMRSVSALLCPAPPMVVFLVYNL